jgi:hypothetical protein
MISPEFTPPLWIPIIRCISLVKARSENNSLDDHRIHNLWENFNKFRGQVTALSSSMAEKDPHQGQSRRMADQQ